jgi:site-specific recombinase XerD
MRGKTMTINALDTTALEKLSAENLSIISALIRQMTGSNGACRLEKPADGLPQWKAKMVQERRSPRTIQTYGYWAERYLKDNPTPTRLDIQSYLARLLEAGRSPAAVENIRKSLRSIFKFLKEEGLWHEDPTERIRKVRVRYSTRHCPTPDEVQKVLKTTCFRAHDTDKLATLIRLIATTGLRNGEA